ncbi:hypothetical protein AK830_g7473 [Neonectria ditissima]|uniref:Tim44-like domain-containing protein n=1 Tax=Neonectria ditissima TaxID=78410 RepID=A0A0P7AZJ4_9HYPO|nr:hypothetical protein AK830_g7473 [Neonectria ditissima]
MPSSVAMGPAAARLLRPGALSPVSVRKCLVGNVGAQFTRSASMPSRGQMIREMEKTAREGAKKTDQETMSQIQKRANDEYFRSGGGPLFPGTFVPLPVSRYPRNPRDFLTYAWYRVFQWGIETMSVLNFKLKSMPSWTTRPKWKAARGKIAPTAKVMYTEMLAAFAAGDKATINNICLGNFSKKLTAAIDRRKPGERTSFELVSFNKGLFYPRVVAHQVHNVNPHDKDMFTEQAVVAICSTQKASRYKASSGELMPGSTRVQQKVEHVVLSRQVSETTYQSGPWRIWGTVPATTMDGYKEEQEWIRREQAKRAGWEEPLQKK